MLKACAVLILAQCGDTNKWVFITDQLNMGSQCSGSVQILISDLPYPGEAVASPVVSQFPLHCVLLWQALYAYIPSYFGGEGVQKDGRVSPGSALRNHACRLRKSYGMPGIQPEPTVCRAKALPAVLSAPAPSSFCSIISVLSMISIQ